ncbi:MAG: DNA polymerase ligase N-terminal domain-containing protein [Candidatus Bathyarchaeia archaeon]
MEEKQSKQKPKSPVDHSFTQVGNNLLKEYHKKRDFNVTTEPQGKEEETQNENKIFVVQEHHAKRLHYDFRLEHDGVLKSWAVPKGIPENTSEKRLAVETEDHPLEYANFEGTIPDGQYGAGKIVIWDKGNYETKAWNEKLIEVILNGKKLSGRYVLVRLKKGTDRNWLLLKGKE